MEVKAATIVELVKQCRHNAEPASYRNMLQNHVAIDEIERTDCIRKLIVRQCKNCVRGSELLSVRFCLAQHRWRNVKSDNIRKLLSKCEAQSSDAASMIQGTPSLEPAEVILAPIDDLRDCARARGEELVAVLLYLRQRKLLIGEHAEIGLLLAKFLPGLVGA